MNYLPKKDSSTMATRVFPLSLIFLSICSAAAANNNAIEEVTVYGTEGERYSAKNASSATGFNSSLLDTARSIQIIPEQIILDQQALELDDTLRNVSGVQPFRVVGGTGDSFLLRGFRVNSIYRDGFRLAQEGRRVQTPNIDRVEVVKGATALLYGQSEPGGIINIITKKPEAEARHYISTTFDDEGQSYTLGDSTGSLNSDDTLLYRVVGSYEDTDTFREAGPESNILRKSFTPSLTWLITPQGSLTASFEVTSGLAPIDRGNVVVSDANSINSIAEVPRSRRFGEDSDELDSIQRNARLHYQHTFNDNWKLDTTINYEKNDARSFQNNPTLGIAQLTPGLPPISSIIIGGGAGLSFTNIPNNGLLLRQPLSADTTDENYFGALRLSGTFNLFGQEHQLAAGFDSNHREADFTSSLSLLTVEQTGIPAALLPVPPTTLFLNLTPIDIFNPIYSSLAPDTTPVSNTETTDVQQGAYIQDSIKISEQWRASIGLRYDSFDREISSRNFLAAFPDPSLAALAFLPGDEQESRQNTKTENELSPNAGLIFQPTENISLYTSYSESFTPNIRNNTITGQAENLDPSEGTQYEVGIKGTLFNEKLNANIAWYDLTLENVLNGTNPLTGEGILNGEQNARGIEIDTSIQFANGWNVIMTYAYTDAEITESTSNQDNRPQGIAENSASIWGSYEFKDGPLKGLGIGSGAFFTGDRFADGANTLELDSFTLVDATAWYYLPIGKNKQVRLQAGVKNLADEEYYIPGTNNFRIGVGQPRTVFTSLAFDF